MRRSLHTCRTAGRYWTPSPRSRPSHSRRACTRCRRRALNELNGINPSAFDILSAVGQQLATTGEHVIADVHMDKIRLMLARLRDIEALQAAVQSAYGNCNLRELHHLRVPHAVDIAGCAISWSEAFIADRADAEDYLPQPADAEALPFDDLLDVILDDEDCVP